MRSRHHSHMHLTLPRSPPACPQSAATIRLLLVLLTLLSLAGVLLPTRAYQQDLTPGKLSGSAIALTRDGGTLAVVNPDSNTLTLISAATREVLSEIEVGTDPRTVAYGPGGNHAYVANRGSGTVSVVDINTQAVVKTIDVGYQPYGVAVAPDGRWVYVTNSGSDTLSVIDTATWQVVKTVPTGERPTGLAISEDSQWLYVTHLLTGEVSVIDTAGLPDDVPDCSRRADLNLDGTVDAADMQRIAVNWRMTSRTPAEYEPACDLDANYSVNVVDVMGLSSQMGDSTCLVISTGSASNLAQSIVVAPDGARAYLPHQRSNAANPAPLFDTSIFPVVSVVDLASNQHLRSERLDLATIDVPVNMPFDAAFSADGSRLYVVNAGSNDISVIDLAAQVAVAHVEVGANPRGVVVSPDGSVAYVNNTLDGTVSVIDLTTNSVTGVIKSTTIPPAPNGMKSSGRSMPPTSLPIPTPASAPGVMPKSPGPSARACVPTAACSSPSCPTNSIGICPTTTWRPSSPTCAPSPPCPTPCRRDN